MISDTNYFKSRFKKWNLNPDKQGVHREYFLDRVAKTKNKLPGREQTSRESLDYKWWFQKFKRKSINSYSRSQLGIIRNLLSEQPEKDSTGVGSRSLGYTSSTKKQPIKDVEARVDDFDLKSWLTGAAREVLLQDITADVIKEEITDSTDF